MEISKLKLELYDLAAIILPGFFLMAEFAVVFLGFPRMLAYGGNPRGRSSLSCCCFRLPWVTWCKRPETD